MSKPDYLVRMEKERDELTQKIDALSNFLLSDDSASLPQMKKHLLHKQELAMCSYLRVLCDRIKLELREL